MGAEPDFPADLFAVGLVALYLLEGAKPDAKALVQHFAEHGTPSAPRGRLPSRCGRSWRRCCSRTRRRGSVPRRGAQGTGRGGGTAAGARARRRADRDLRPGRPAARRGSAPRAQRFKRGLRCGRRTDGPATPCERGPAPARHTTDAVVADHTSTARSVPGPDTAHPAHPADAADRPAARPGPAVTCRPRARAVTGVHTIRPPVRPGLDGRRSPRRRRRCRSGAVGLGRNATGGCPLSETGSFHLPPPQPTRHVGVGVGCGGQHGATARAVPGVHGRVAAPAAGPGAVRAAASRRGSRAVPAAAHRRPHRRVHRPESAVRPARPAPGTRRRRRPGPRPGWRCRCCCSRWPATPWVSGR